MANIKIYADLTDASIHFDGSTVEPQPLGSVEASAIASEPNRIKIKRIEPKADGSERVFFKRFKANRVETQAGVALVNTSGFTTQQVIDYLNVEFTKTLVLDVASYRGVWNATTNTPALADLTPANGDFLYVTTAGTFETVDYAVNDTVRYNEGSTSWDKIEDQSAKVTEIENSAKGDYDIYVDADFTGASSGSILRPYSSIADAITNSVEGDRLFIKGINVVASEILLPHSLYFYGAELSEIKFASYNASNGNIFRFTGTDNSKSFTFKNIAFKNAGGYALYIQKAAKVVIENCTLLNNGWNGTGLNTVLAEAGGVLGHDSSSADLQAFYAGANASNGGATRIEEVTQILIIGNTVKNNLRGLRVQDCGIYGGGFITRNQSSSNIESGIYLAVGSLGGCQNITTTMNVSAYNANNGLLVIGGISNKFSQNEVSGNWNAGFCAWGSANSTLRDCGLYDNNRSALNGIGNTADAKASIQINESYDLSGTTITINPAFRFIAEILDTQVHYTGLGSNTDKIGFLISSAVGTLADSSKNIIKIDDVGFIGQDYAIDLSEVDISNLRLSLGDNSYQSIGLKAVKAPLVGNYSELPFSNHVMEVPEVDIVVDTLKMTIALHEGIGGNVINIYNVNELQSVLKANSVDIIQKGTDKIQLRDLTLGNVYINGVAAGSNLSTMNDSINSALDMTLIEYKDFIESEVGVTGSGDTATFYYIESPDGNFEYPLFKTAEEANAFDLANGGTGTNHTHTYADDATNTTWYMPTNLGVMTGTSAPLNGSYGNSTSIVWNLQTTEPDSSHVPTFTDVTYNIAEGSSVNVQYKPAGDSNTYSLSTLSAGYADNGYAIIGTAETITNGVDIQHIITVTKANDFGSVVGYITLNITNDVTNDVSSNDTAWTKAVDFSGGNEYMRHTHSYATPGYVPLALSNGTYITKNSNPLYTASSSSSRPWATTIVFKADSNNSLQTIWNNGEGFVSGADNFGLEIDANDTLWFYYGQGATSTSAQYNRCYVQIGIDTSKWYGVYIAHKGGRLSSANATKANLGECFDIRVMSSADSFATISPNRSGANSGGNWQQTGRRMDKAVNGYYSIGAATGAGQKPFYGKVASSVITTLKNNSLAPVEAEIKTMITDPIKWENDYKQGTTFRLCDSSSTSSVPSTISTTYMVATQIHLMGDSTNVYPSNYNDAYPEIFNNLRWASYTKLVMQNMVANDIENVSIAGLS